MSEKKYSVKELVEILGKMPIYFSSPIGILLAGEMNYAMFALLNSRLKLHQYQGDLLQAIRNWNWDVHEPHEDDAILVLVEELLEEYREK